MSEAQRIEAVIYSLPSSLDEAVKEMCSSSFVKETLGAHVFNKYIEAKNEEWDRYRTRVTQWEIDKYLTRY